ncbi:MAG: hypothetical protein M5R42_12605 [Rhodocyclaceae bacterium]|nr:hypothetical protein [Rhodocyclaceae bacterium]
MRILLVKTSSLGDVVHNLPVASDIRARFTEAYIDWVVEEGFGRDIPAPASGREPRDSGRSATLAPQPPVSGHLARAACFQAAVRTELRPGARYAGLIKSGLMARLARGRHAGYAAEVARRAARSARCYDDTTPSRRTCMRSSAIAWLVAAALGVEPTCRSITASPPPRWLRPWLPATP